MFGVFGRGITSLAVLLVAVLSSGCYWGLAYGPYRDGQSPDTVQPTESEIGADLAQIQPLTNRLRTYSSVGVGAQAARQAAARGMSVTGGIYLGGTPGDRDREINSALTLANEGVVDALVVGNETLLGSVLTPADLIGAIRKVRAGVPPNVRVTTAEPWSVWLAHPELYAEVDYVMIHVHPFWEGQNVTTAAQYVLQRFEEVRAASGMRVVIGETGWPSAGGNGLQAGASQGSEGNQAAFLREFTALADKAGIEYFLFSAYDEEWKWTEGFVTVPAVASLDDRTLAGRFAGSSWGIFRSDGTLKPLLAPLFPAAGPHPDRSERVILDNRGLHNLYDMGVDSSGSRRDWLHTTGEGMQMAYPSGQPGVRYSLPSGHRWTNPVHGATSPASRR